MKSIRARLSFGIIGMLVFFAGTTWFLNFNIIEKYYVEKNKGILLKFAEEIEKVEESQLENYIRYQERAKGMFVFVYNSNLERKMQDNYFGGDRNNRMEGRFNKEDRRPEPPEMKRNGEDKTTDKGSARQGGNKNNGGKDRFMGKMEDGTPMPPEVFFMDSFNKLNGKKYVFENPKNVFKSVQLITLIYKMENGEYLFIVKPNESIAESAKIAANFSLFSGILTIIMGTFYALFFSRKFTQPILNINETAKKIANLQFEEKCEIKSNDEIGELGKSINAMSEKLSEKINKLKEINNKLEEEIEYERSMEKLRKEFVSSVSHELRTPVALIRGYAEGLKCNVMEDEGDKEFYCDVIIDEAGKMTKLISDLLDLAQIESGTYKIEKKDINLSEITDMLLSKYNLILKEKNIKLELDIEDEMWINGDRVRIEQVITNFINNGINHIDVNKNLKVTLKTKDEKVKLSVFNSGKNIPQEEEDRIWESFYKLDKARSREYGGVGLGLSIVSGILKLHNAKYGFDNIEKGVEFWFEIDKKI